MTVSRTEFLKDIRFLVLDVDGVLTDGGMYYSESGDEFKKFSTRDGLGIMRLAASGVKIGIISSGINKKLIQKRAELLKIEYVYVGFDDKLKILDGWLKELGMDYSQVAYIGDDVNDLPVIMKAGFAACPADAADKVRNAVNTVLEKKGGEGCVREFIEKYLLDV